MRYSLSSRFRGAILGTAVGAALENSSSSKQYLLSPKNQPDWWHQQSNQTKPQSQGGEAQTVSLLVLSLQSLIQQGRFDLAAWRYTLSQYSNLNTLNAIIAGLPVALFYHENEIKLRQNLQLAWTAVGKDDPQSQAAAIAFGYLIAKSLQTKLHWTKLIKQTLDFLGEPQTDTAQKLTQVGILLEQNAGLEQAVNALGKTNQPSVQLALSCYCYLSSQEDFQLSIRRAAGVLPQPISAMTGALSGAYNGVAGIPATLRLLLSGKDNQSILITDMTNEIEMLRLCDALVAVWSGVYEQAHPQIDLTQVTAIAAPRLLRAR